MTFVQKPIYKVETFQRWEKMFIYQLQINLMAFGKLTWKCRSNKLFRNLRIGWKGQGYDQAAIESVMPNLTSKVGLSSIPRNTQFEKMKYKHCLCCQ